MEKVNYIVYELETFIIIHVSKYYTKEIYRLCQFKNTGWVNVTHLKHKAILAKINEVNGTNY